MAQSISPRLQILVPPAPIEIYLNAGQPFGESRKITLNVSLDLQGDPLPAVAIVVMEITVPAYYLFTNSSSRKDFRFPMNSNQQTVPLDFEIKNLNFQQGNPWNFDFRLTTYEESNQGINDYAFGSSTVRLVQTQPIRFKRFK
ncbi:MAG: hypothetical protein EOO88_15150 [Pedobacter sp.]|nr:MAG: hypothetical protein EOO88_15150 [Pedobacter sp.]